jgi:hypothetical protein
LISLAVTGVKWIRGKEFVHAEFKLSSADGVIWGNADDSLDSSGAISNND